MKAVVTSFVLLLACVVLTSCASLESHVTEPGRNLQGVQRFFVLRNLSDNHGIEERIVRALRARGFVVESGPATLQPDTAQVVIGYEDRWAWDFSNHLVVLTLSARDPKAYLPYATATYVKHVAFTTETDAVVGQVVDKLLEHFK